MPIPSFIKRRETRGGGGNFINHCSADISLVQRLELSQTIKGHSGCVNTVNWNNSGSLLISGSDDTRLCIYDYTQQCKLLQRIDTGHTANIFSAKFMPFQDDRIACCAGDDEVRTFHNGTLDQVYTCHRGRVKKIATHVHNLHSFLTASEDGTVRNFDIRVKNNRSDDNVVVRVRSPYGSRRIELYSIAYDPICPNYFIVGGGDPYVRLYDTRVLGSGRGGSDTDEKEEYRCIKAFCPRDMEGKGKSTFSMTGHITGVAYSWDGREGLASYSGHGVYLFDIKGNRDARPLMPKTRKIPDDDEDEEDDEEEEDEDEDEDEDGKGEEKEENDKKTNTINKRKGKNVKVSADPNNNNNNASSSTEKTEEEVDQGESYSSVYEGHCNIRTVKEVNFFGPCSEYVISGSDDGRIFIWDKKTTKLVNMMQGDRDVVNCCSGHPYDPILATSGIENNVKIWVPKAEKSVDLAEAESVMKQNIATATGGRPYRNIPASVLHALIRTLASQPEDDEDGEGGDGAQGGGFVVDEDGDDEDEPDEGRRIRCQYQ